LIKETNRSGRIPPTYSVLAISLVAHIYITVSYMI